MHERSPQPALGIARELAILPDQITCATDLDLWQDRSKAFRGPFHQTRGHLRNTQCTVFLIQRQCQRVAETARPDQDRSPTAGPAENRDPLRFADA